MNQFIAPRSKLYAHLDTLHAIQQGHKPPPVNVEIDLSNRCSLGCSWCHFAYTHTRGPLAGKVDKPHGAIDGGDLMDYYLAKRILDQLEDAGVRSVTWTGGGEPTLHPDFEQIVRYADASGLEQGLYTHGGHVNDVRAALLKETLTWVYISLDECTPEQYKRSKGVDRFDTVCANVRRLVAAEGKATIGLGFLLHKDNLSQVRAMVELGRALGVDYVQFRPTIHYEQDAPGKLAENTAWVKWAIGYLNAYKDDPFVIADIDRFRMYADWRGHGYPTCNWAALQTVITPNGKVWRCTNKREHPDALLGDLTVESFADLWQRSGGACGVDGGCRVMCIGHTKNLMLDPMMQPMLHANFI
jgi:MoaA/NifB/PqqE/SkfB family radical SAM enzyme